MQFNIWIYINIFQMPRMWYKTETSSIMMSSFQIGIWNYAIAFQGFRKGVGKEHRLSLEWRKSGWPDSGAGVSAYMASVCISVGFSDVVHAETGSSCTNQCIYSSQLLQAFPGPLPWSRILMFTVILFSYISVVNLSVSKCVTQLQSRK